MRHCSDGHNRKMNDWHAEIAQLAAMLIVEDGLDFESAKRKAFSRATGRKQMRGPHEELPSNAAIEEAIREHINLFHSETQPQRLRALRQAALELMQALPKFDLWLTGAAAKGIATDHSVLSLVCVHDNSKDLGIALINLGLSVQADELDGRFGSRRDEVLRVDWRGEPTVIRVVGFAQGIRRWGGLPQSELEHLLRQTP